jgi:hypothetical protein
VDSEPGHPVNRRQHDQNCQWHLPNREVTQGQSCWHEDGHQWGHVRNDFHPQGVGRSDQCVRQQETADEEDCERRRDGLNFFLSGDQGMEAGMQEQMDRLEQVAVSLN